MGVFIGETAFTVDILQPQKTGYVRFKGELWKAESNDFIKKDVKVKILKKDGSLLTVEALK